MRLAKISLISVLALTPMTKQCDDSGSRRRQAPAQGQTPVPAATATPPLAAASAGLSVQEWHGSYVSSSSPGVRQLPFRLPDTGAFEVLTFPAVNFIATESPLGGHPENDVGTEAREALRKYLKSAKSDDLFFNGQEEFTEGGKDLVGDVAEVQARARREKAAVHWVRNQSQLQQTIAESVEHVWKPGAPTPAAAAAPASLMNYLRGEFESLVNALPPDGKARLSGWRVEAGTPPDPAPAGESLWLKQSSKVVWVSPLVIKGLLLQATERAAETEYKRFLSQGTTPKLFADPAIVNDVGTRFRDSVRYLLAHGIAHASLASAAASPADVEKEAHAVALAIAGTAEPRSFEEFLEAATRSGESEWGVERPGDGRDFASLLKP
jgi:hypothetical protein